MSLLEFIKRGDGGYTTAEREALANWHQAFAVDEAWRLIQRNIDRECARKDIEAAILDEYLKDIAGKYAVGGWSPVGVMDEVLKRRQADFLLPGRPLRPGSGSRLSRIIRLDHLIKYHLQHIGFPVLSHLDRVIGALQSAAITGLDLENTKMGREGYPAWVTKTDSLPSRMSANDVRDCLGLKHIEHGHLVEMTYPDAILDNSRLALRAPTVIDGAFNGAENWIFSKRRDRGGPDWGFTVNLGTSQTGEAEAVHGCFHVTVHKARQITVSYRGQVTASAPQVNFVDLIART